MYYGGVDLSNINESNDWLNKFCDNNTSLITVNDLSQITNESQVNNISLVTSWTTILVIINDLKTMNNNFITLSTKRFIALQKQLYYPILMWNWI